ncbi:alcohol dehydrogenase GroES-like domain-containing protein [Aspergillus taichungensis]|uniref:Alcohol dehydrogenase GroES-like domain-containing protein n=1 Tax=Aspergillus taichungensis TaxID=482145 RepID=A0A2J5I478_9EURO|nr:alcohol dehydrogenase GroES-like domain-containing protein [Aspergillus taichungensis]
MSPFLQETMDCLVQSASGQPQTEVRVKPGLKAPHDVVVHVSAVALNPTDFKSPASNPTPGAIMGCDFMGTVISAGTAADKDFPPATRVCGFVHGSNPGNPETGSFAEYLVTDSRLLIRVPDSWTDLEGAAFGGVGWGTVALAMELSLQLQGRPSKPAPPRDDGSRIPVLVYGGATATGTMACQILSMSGYQPIATASSSSSTLVLDYGAAAVVPYASPTCGETLRDKHTGGNLRHALDCISSPESVKCCFTALGRIGARYAGLDYVPDDWRTRKAIKVHMPLTYALHGHEIKFKGPYHRDADPSMLELGSRWRDEMQGLVDAGRLRPHPAREVRGKWKGIVDGLEMMKAGEVRGQKLVVALDGKDSV